MKISSWSLLFILFSFSMVISPDKTSGIQGELEKRTAQPNILFIVSEDNGPALGAYEAPVKTPHLDRLAQKGVRFQNAYVAQAGCSPSRAAFLTGLYPHQNGQIGLATWKYSMYDKNTPNLVNDLNKVGYRTGIIGKLHVNPKSTFDFDWEKIPGANFQRDSLDRYANYAGEFFCKSSPFFLQVNYPDAHRPFISQVDGLPQKVLRSSDVESLPYIGLNSGKLRELTANYYNSMMRLDELVGDLLSKLKASGKYKNTLIVYIGDHGADILRGKRTSYEGGLRIPMIISWPRIQKKNSVYHGLVNTIDLYPTFMEFSRNSIPDHLPGKSLLSIIRGDFRLIREYLFTEYHVHSNHNPYPQRTVRDKRFKLIHNLVAEYKNPGYDFTLNNFDFGGIKQVIKSAPELVRKAYKRMKNPPEFELYDLKKDPYEWNNLAGNPKYKDILSNLKDVLKDWQMRTSDPLIDKQIAEKLYEDIIQTNAEKVDIPYHEYMAPQLFNNN